MNGAYAPIPAEPDDGFFGDDPGLPGANVQEFWRWRYANLMDDTTKGDFAEWLVGKLLGLEMPPGGYISGDNVDLRGPDGITIEVKSSSYWQSWKLRDFRDLRSPRWLSVDDIPKPSSDKQIQFRGLCTRVIIGSQLEKHSGFKSDLYVFAFHKGSDPLKWNARDLAQWEFYPLCQKQLVEAKQRRDKQYGRSYESFSVTLPQVRELFGAPPMKASQLRVHATKILSDAAAVRLGMR